MRFTISCILLFILYIIKKENARQKIIEEIVRIEEFAEQLHNAKCAYAEAIIFSYLYSVGSVYAGQTDGLFGNNAFSSILEISKLFVPIYLTHIQNKHKNGTANSLDDKSGAMFYLCAVNGSFWFMIIYMVRILLLLNRRR